MGITIGIFGMFPWNRTNMQKIFYQGLYFMSSYAHFSVEAKKKLLWIIIMYKEPRWKYFNATNTIRKKKENKESDWKRKLLLWIIVSSGIEILGYPL